MCLVLRPRKQGLTGFAQWGVTVVGNPAATVITSSPGFNLLLPSLGEVKTAIANKLAEEPELTVSACLTPTNSASFFQTGH